MNIKSFRILFVKDCLHFVSNVMNTEMKKTKRKKWRTRKYLNEIRKRSQRCGNTLSNDYVDDCSNKIKFPTKKSSNITNKRLTLSMFPKAVRSETITRPVLAEIKHKQSINDIVKDKTSPIVLNTNINDKFQSKSDDQHSISDILIVANELTHDEQSIEDDKTPFGSSVLVSHDRKDDAALSDESNINLFTPTPPKETPELYENFMEEPPHLLREVLPDRFFKYNAMKDMREELNKTETEILKSPFNTSTCIKKGKLTRNSIVENPIEYIRQAQTVPNDVTESCNSSSEVSDIQPSMQSPLPLLMDPTIILDTPEYNYYPHKLHE